jgi:hypothetical protein
MVNYKIQAGGLGTVAREAASMKSLLSRQVGLSRHARFAGAAVILLVAGCTQPPSPQPAAPLPPPPAAPAFVSPPQPPTPGETLAQVLLPGQTPVGLPKPNYDIRLLPGGENAATKLFDRLTVGAKDVTPKNFPGVVRRLPDGTTLTYRFADGHGSLPAILLNTPSVPFHRIEFPAQVTMSRDGGGGM